MKKYSAPIIEILSFDEEEIILQNSGMTAAEAVTAMQGNDAGLGTASSDVNLHMTTVKVTELD
jgi:hypothetical protein